MKKTKKTEAKAKGGKLGGRDKKEELLQLQLLSNVVVVVVFVVVDAGD